MQTMADVLNMPIKIARSEQTVALGAAMFAATASGVHKTIFDAMNTMGQGFDAEYQPNPEHASQYNEVYAAYEHLGTIMEEFYSKD
jgi:L-ribulokinase